MKHDSLRPDGDETCRLYVTPGIKAILDGGDPSAGFPHPLADRVVQMFVYGWAYRVTRRYGIETDLEQLVDLDEAWVLCFRQPKPGFRLFGRFLERNTFIGLRLHDRHDIGTRQEYERAANRMIEDWKDIFGSVDPLRSRDLDAYLSGNYVDVDEDF